MDERRLSNGRPTISLVTGGSEGGSHARIARWLRAGFEHLGESFDVVYVEGPASVERVGSTRIVRLGTSRLRWAPLALAQYLRSAKPQFALASPIEIAVVAIGVGRLTRTTVVPWEQTMVRVHVRDHARRLRMLPLLERLTYGSVPAIAVTSVDVASDLGDHLGHRVRQDRIHVLPNPIDAVEIRRLAEPAASSSNRLRFCAIGRLARQKGYDVLLEAAAKAAPSLGGNWELLVCGSGPLREALVRRSAELGLTDHVSFLGFVENPYPLLASADVFVHAARWEGFGLVLAEALTLGVPVIATACPGGPREILDDGRVGVLVPPEDPGALAAELVRIAEDTGRRGELASAGRARVADYAPEKIAARVVGLAGLS
jgi:glycosyltransferase involved in cell wall biosynthesis